MLSVMIADDEMAIVFLINRLIKWKELDMQPVGFAMNGQEAFEMAKENKPDILITDIQMPGMTGLELIAGLKPICPDTSFVIVSGYQEFEYAQQALRNGVEDYLLKPIKENELNRILQRIRQKKGENANLSQMKASIQREHMASRKRWMKRELWENSLNTETLDSSETIDGFFEYEDAVFYPVLMKMDLREDDRDRLKTLQEKVAENFLEEFRDGECDAEAILTDEYSVLAVLNFRQGEQANLLHRLKNFQNRMQVKYNEWHFPIVVSGPLRKNGNWRRTLSYMRKLFFMRGWLGTGEVLTWKPDKEIYLDCGMTLSASENRELHKRFSSGNAMEFAEYVERLLNGVYTPAAPYPWKLFSLSCQVMEALALPLSDMGIPTEALEEEKKLWRWNLEQAESLLMIKRAFYTFAQHVKEKQEDIRRDEENLPIKMARQYITEHYADPITMDQLAAYVNLNPTYFSGLFKKVTGQNFSEYLTECRMEQAKELLKNTKEAIPVIADKVGYADARYFNKVFLKNVGIKPNEYRKIHH